MHSLYIDFVNFVITQFPQIWDALPLWMKAACIIFLLLVIGIHTLSDDAIAFLRQLQEFRAQQPRPPRGRRSRHNWYE